MAQRHRGANWHSYNGSKSTYFITYYKRAVMNYESFVEPLRGSQIIKHILFYY